MADDKTIRRAGRGARQALEALPMAVAPLAVLGTGIARGAARDISAAAPAFLEGMFNRPAGTFAKPAATAKTPKGPDASTMISELAAKGGRAALAYGQAMANQPPPSAQEMLMARISAMIEKPKSRRELKDAVGMLPAPQKRVTADEMIATEAASLSQQMFEARAKQIAADLAGGKVDQVGASAAYESAAKEHLNNMTVLRRGNPVNATMADLIEQAKE